MHQAITATWIDPVQITQPSYPGAITSSVHRWSNPHVWKLTLNGSSLSTLQCDTTWILPRSRAPCSLAQLDSDFHPTSGYIIHSQDIRHVSARRIQIHIIEILAQNSKVSTHVIERVLDILCLTGAIRPRAVGPITDCNLFTMRYINHDICSRSHRFRYSSRVGLLVLFLFPPPPAIYTSRLCLSTRSSHENLHPPPTMTALARSHAPLATPRWIEGTTLSSRTSNIMVISKSTTRTVMLAETSSPLIPTTGPNIGEFPSWIFSTYAAMLTAQNPDMFLLHREMIREYAAEMLGTMVLILFGNGVNCQVVLGSNTNVSATEKGDYTSLCLGWACGTSIPSSVQVFATCHRLTSFYALISFHRLSPTALIYPASSNIINHLQVILTVPSIRWCPRRLDLWWHLGRSHQSS